MPLSFLDGYKTVIAGVGLLGLSVVQASQGELNQALTTFFAALAALGLRHAIARGS